MSDWHDILNPKFVVLELFPKKCAKWYFSWFLGINCQQFTSACICIFDAIYILLVGEDIQTTECNCRGNLSDVHQSCLRQWVYYKGSNKCEICNGRFSTITPPSTPGLLQTEVDNYLFYGADSHGIWNPINIMKMKISKNIFVSSFYIYNRLAIYFLPFCYLDFHLLSYR